MINFFKSKKQKAKKKKNNINAKILSSGKYLKDNLFQISIISGIITIIFLSWASLGLLREELNEKTIARQIEIGELEKQLSDLEKEKEMFKSKSSELNEKVLGLETSLDEKQKIFSPGELEPERWIEMEDDRLGFSFKYPPYWDFLGDSGRGASWEFKNGDKITSPIPHMNLSIWSKKDLAKRQADCEEDEADNDCDENNYPMPTEELLGQVEIIKELENDLPEDYRDQLPRPGKMIDCAGSRGYYIASSVRLENINQDAIRTVGYCGDEAKLGNFYYYSPIILDSGVVIETRFRLFPENSAIYSWAETELGNGDDGIDLTAYLNNAVTVFTKALQENRTDSVPEIVRKQIEEYDSLLTTLKF